LACGKDIVGYGTPMVHPKGWHYVFCQECNEANEVIGGTDLPTLRVIHRRRILRTTEDALKAGLYGLMADAILVIH